MGKKSSDIHEKSGIRIPPISILVFTKENAVSLYSCIQSILQQETDSEYEIIIIDRGSTDDTRDICQGLAAEYPDKIRFYSRTSPKNRIMSPQYTINIHGQYAILCNGSEEWVDTLKIEKQSRFLYSHPDYSLCFHKTLFHNDQECQYYIPSLPAHDYLPEEIDISLLLRRYSPLFKLSDSPISLHLSLYERLGTDLFIGRIKQGKIKYLSDIISLLYTDKKEDIRKKRSLPLYKKTSGNSM